MSKNLKKNQRKIIGPRSDYFSIQMITEEIFEVLKFFIIEDIASIIMNYLVYKTAPKLKLETLRYFIATCPFCKDQTTTGEIKAFLLDTKSSCRNFYCYNCDNFGYLPEQFNIIRRHGVDVIEYIHPSEEFRIKENVYEIPLLKINYMIRKKYYGNKNSEWYTIKVPVENYNFDCIIDYSYYSKFRDQFMSVTFENGESRLK